MHYKFRNWKRLCLPMNKHTEVYASLRMHKSCELKVYTNGVQVKIKTFFEKRICNYDVRDITIRQRRRPWKPRGKIDSASFQTISLLSKVAQLLKRRGFMLKLKKGSRTRVQTEMVEFIALPFPSSKKNLVISRRSCAGTAKKCIKKRDARAELIFYLLNLLLYDVAVAVAVAVS